MFIYENGSHLVGPHFSFLSALTRKAYTLSYPWHTFNKVFGQASQERYLFELIVLKWLIFVSKTDAVKSILQKLADIVDTVGVRTAPRPKKHS